jgi:hypothetical protein
MKQPSLRHWLAALALLCLAGGPVRAAERTDLSAQELDAAQQRIKGSASFTRAAARNGDPRMYVVSASKYKGDKGAGGPEELVEVLYYKYEGGVTLRAALDGRTGDLLELEELKAYPTPLADEETQEAIRLAKEKSNAVRQVVANAPAGSLGVYAMPTVISLPSDLRYGHRIVLVTFYPKAGSKPTAMVEVDLTQKTVKPFPG